MKKILVIVLILIAAASGFLARGFVKSPANNSNSPKASSAWALLDNPVVYSSLVEGSLKSKTKDSITLEKDGKQLEIPVRDTAVFAKLRKDDLSASPSAFLKLDELETGSVIGAAVQKDPISPDFKIVGEQFWIK